MVSEQYMQGGDNTFKALDKFDKERRQIEFGPAWMAVHSNIDYEAAKICNEYPLAGRYILTMRLYPHQRVEWHQAALASARRLGDVLTEGQHLNNLGLTSAAAGRFQQAIQYYQQSIKLKNITNDKQGQAISLNNPGTVYKNLENIDKPLPASKNH